MGIGVMWVVVIAVIVWQNLFAVARVLGLILGGIWGCGYGIGLWIHQKTGSPSIPFTTFVVLGLVVEGVSIWAIGQTVWFYASMVI